jgi:hypothetical protein
MLERAIRSVLAQTYEGVRVAVFDNASGDETAAVVDRIRRGDDRVEYCVHERNIGPEANFDVAMRSVRTPLFSLLSDDDLLFPDFLREGVAAFDSHPEAFFFCARIPVYNELVPGIRRRHLSWQPGLYQPGADVVVRMLGDNFATTGVIFRAEVRDTVGPFSRFPVDRDYMAVAASKHPFVVSDREQAVFIVHRSSFTAADPDFIEDHSRLVSVRFARECLFSSLPPLLGNERFSSDEKSAIFDAAMRLARGDTLYLLLIKALPARRFDEIDQALVLGRWLGFGAATRVALRLLRGIARLPLFGRAIAAAARFVARAATKRLYEPLDAPQNRALVAFVRGKTAEEAGN